MSNIRTYTMIALAMSLAIGCQKNDDQEEQKPKEEKKTIPWKELTPATPIYDNPKSVANCNLDDVKFLRNIAKANGFEDDFKSDNPSEWKTEHLGVIWTKEKVNDKETYFALELGGAKGGGKGISKLDFFDVNNAFSKLQKIELTAPQLSTVFIQEGLPALKSIILKGKEGNQVAPLEKIHLSSLASLETLSLTDFPNLKKTNDEDYFAISLYYYYENLVEVTLNNIGATDIIIEPQKTLKSLTLANNSNLTNLNISDASLKDLNFNATNYPKLTNLKLNKITAESASTLRVENLPLLTDINISKIPSVTQASVTNCPKVTSLMIKDGAFSAISLQGLPELKTIDLSGNKLSSIDLTAFAKATKIHLNDNMLKGANPFKLPSKVTDLSLQGNELLTAVDLSSYKALSNVNINGYKKGKTSEFSQPNALAYLKIAGLNNLERLLVNWNSLSTIDTGGEENITDKINLIECEHNNLHPDAIYALKKAFPSLNFSLSGAGGSSKSCSYVKQRPFKVTEVVNNKVTFAISQEPTHGAATEVSIENANNNTYTYNQSTGVLSVVKPGTYKIKVKNTQLLGQMKDGFISEEVTFK